MKLTFDIIKNNLQKLDFAKQNFPILLEYSKIKSDKNITESERLMEISPLSSDITFFDLSRYAKFIDWIIAVEDSNQKIIYDKLKYPDLREAVSKNCIDRDVKRIMSNKTKSDFDKLLNNFSLFRKYNGQSTYSGRGVRRYSSNLIRSEAIIANYIILNEVEVNDTSNICPYYTSEIPDVSLSINSEIFFTKKLIDSIIPNLKENCFDIRKINIPSILSSIESRIKEEILSFTVGEQVICIESTLGITKGKIYNILNLDIPNWGGDKNKVRIKIIDDNSIESTFYYRNFESLNSKRSSILDSILE